MALYAFHVKDDNTRLWIQTLIFQYIPSIWLPSQGAWRKAALWASGPASRYIFSLQSNRITWTTSWCWTSTKWKESYLFIYLFLIHSTHHFLSWSYMKLQISHLQWAIRELKRSQHCSDLLSNNLFVVDVKIDFLPFLETLCKNLALSRPHVGKPVPRLMVVNTNLMFKCDEKGRLMPKHSLWSSSS